MEAAAVRESPPGTAEPAEVEVGAFPMRPSDGRIAFACARATARLPTGFTFGDGSNRCLDRGYPQEEIDAEGISGGTSHHTILVSGCSLKISSREDPGGGRTPPRSDSRVYRVTPEGTSLLINVSVGLFVRRGGTPYPQRDPTCARFVEPLVRGIDESLVVRPLRDVVTQTHADITSAGHGITLEIPAGYWLFSVGGTADEHETAYQLRGPTDTTVTLFTSWDRVAGQPVRDFEPRVVAEGRRAESGPMMDGDCRRIGAAGPEPRIVTTIEFCGPRENDAELLSLLRAMRFTPP
jgi:hypothetical protein